LTIKYQVNFHNTYTGVKLGAVSGAAAPSGRVNVAESRPQENILYNFSALNKL